jgi:hypothetical protein
MSSRPYQRARYWDLKEKGLCTNCAGKIEPERKDKGRGRCQHCTDTAKRNKERLNDSNW